MAVLIQRVIPDDVWPATRLRREHLVDVRVEAGLITQIAPRIRPRPGDDLIDGHGGALLPGFHDHHVHLRAWAAAQSSVHVGPSDVQTAADLEARLRLAPGEPGSWVRAIGYHESVAGVLDRNRLDQLAPDRPVRIQHRSGALWVLNSRALDALDVDTVAAPTGVEVDGGGRLTGKIWRADRWLHDQLAAIGADRPPDLGAVSRAAAAAGVTGFTDATPEEDQGALLTLGEAQTEGSILQRLHLMTGPGLADQRGPDVGVSGANLTQGPVKFLLDDTQLPDFEALASAMRVAHSGRRPVALHCVTRTQAALATAALVEAGSISGDRMEHGAVLGADLMATLRSLGVTVITQPGFVLTRGDQYLVDVDPDDVDDLWRLGSLLGAGIRVAVSTDAPFGPHDPWLVVKAATTRMTTGGRNLGAAERIGLRQAASLFCGRPEDPATARTISLGEVGDLMVLAVPLDEALAATDAPTVLATVVGGAVAHRLEGQAD